MLREMERREAIQNLSTDFSIIHGLGADDMAEFLMQEFAAADAGNTGLLSMQACHAALSGCKLGLSAVEVGGIMSAAETDAFATTWGAPANRNALAAAAAAIARKPKREM